MREIKFRGMNINGEWYHGLLAHTESKNICSDKGWFISNKSGAPFAYQVRPETIGQFTGLKDMNGKEIFEGDVVVFRDRNFVVVYKQDSYYVGWVAVEDINNHNAYIHIWYDNIEIIGNIHENPDLIKVKL